MTEPHVLPVRVELRAGPDGPACSFTVHLPFCFPPGPGHSLILDAHGQTGVRVADVFHFVPSGDDPPTCLVTTSPLVLDDYDALLRTMDWFKALYDVEDFRANRTDPEPYYSCHRNVVHVLGLTKDPHPLIDYDAVAIKVFAEACRAVMLAELDPAPEELADVLQSLNPIVQGLHESVLARRRQEPDGAEMLAVIKEWEGRINPERTITWQASVEKCIGYAKVVFAKLRSIPADRLPKSIGE